MRALHGRTRGRAHAAGRVMRLLQHQPQARACPPRRRPGGPRGRRDARQRIAVRVDARLDPRARPAAARPSSSRPRPDRERERERRGGQALHGDRRSARSTPASRTVTNTSAPGRHVTAQRRAARTLAVQHPRPRPLPGPARPRRLRARRRERPRGDRRPVRRRRARSRRAASPPCTRASIGACAGKRFAAWPITASASSRPARAHVDERQVQVALDEVGVGCDRPASSMLARDVAPGPSPAAPAPGSASARGWPGERSQHRLRLVPDAHHVLPARGRACARSTGARRGRRGCAPTRGRELRLLVRLSGRRGRRGRPSIGRLPVREPPSSRGCGGLRGPRRRAPPSAAMRADAPQEAAQGGARARKPGVGAATGSRLRRPSSSPWAPRPLASRIAAPCSTRAASSSSA